jgi:DNA-binding MarR family transcriptional regulator
MDNSSLAGSISQLFFVLRAAMDEALREIDLTSPQFTALDALSREPGMTNAELARRCSVTPQTMHANVLGLESAGLVVRQPHLTQARLLQLYLSNAGEQMAEEGRFLVTGVEARLLMLMSTAERNQLGNLIRQCLATLSR